jgi:PAS domain S-box-containing protein
MIQMKIRRAVKYIFAHDEEFSLEDRLFLSSFVVGIFTGILGTLVNLIFITSLPAVILPFILTILLIIVYLFVRVKKNLDPFKIPIIILAQITLAIIWVFNGGINGSNIMPGFVVLILGILVFPKKYKKYVLLLFIALNITVYLIQFFIPEIIVGYESETSRWFDSIFTLIYCAYFIFLIIKFIQKQYALERRNSEESEKKYRELVENSPDAITIYVNGKVVFINKACQKLMAAPNADDLLGQPVIQFVHPDFRTFVGERMKMAASSDIALPLTEEKFVRLDGIAVDVEVKAMPILLNNKPAVQLIVRDITEGKKVKEALRESEEKHRILFMNSPDAYLIIVDGIFTDCNKAAEDMLGTDRTHIIGKTPGMISPEFQPDGYKSSFASKDRIEEALQKGSNTFEWVYKRADGSDFFVEVSIAVINLEGRSALFTTWRDISKRKQDETELIKAKEKAEESDRLKSAFLANMSHEIRTPMNGILGFTELLKTPNLSGEQQQEFIQIIKKSGDRLLNIINDIIDISKIESGLMKFTISDTNINEQLDYIHDFFNPEAEQKGLQLFLKNHLPIEEEIIKTDSEKTYAILTNLVKNALKFTNSGSIEFGCEKKGEFLEFFVRDTGIGIRDELKEIIFQRFRQGSESLSRDYEGAGLGLSISKAYINMLGGQLWVESEAGKGSTFYFSIPNVISHDVDSFYSTVNQGKNGLSDNLKLKILIAEDDETSELLISLAVKKISKEIILVKSGLAAIEACRNNPDIDLILMDIKMPTMDGCEATKQIRLFNKKVVIVAQTAFGMIDDRQRALDAGCNDYISKPINVAHLKEIILTHVKKHQPK